MEGCFVFPDVFPLKFGKINIKGKTADFLGLIGNKKASASLVTILLENA